MSVICPDQLNIISICKHLTEWNPKWRAQINWIDDVCFDYNERKRRWKKKERKSETLSNESPTHKSRCPFIRCSETGAWIKIFTRNLFQIEYVAIYRSKCRVSGIQEWRLRNENENEIENDTLSHFHNLSWCCVGGCHFTFLLFSFYFLFGFYYYIFSIWTIELVYFACTQIHAKNTNFVPFFIRFSILSYLKPAFNDDNDDNDDNLKAQTFNDTHLFSFHFYCCRMYLVGRWNTPCIIITKF